MTEQPLNIVASTLDVRASGLQYDPQDDLNLPDGKSIAELLNEQKEKNNSK
jgi:hypothetical protein